MADPMNFKNWTYDTIQIDDIVTIRSMKHINGAIVWMQTDTLTSDEPNGLKKWKSVWPKL